MEISKIDRNFLTENAELKNGAKYFHIPAEPLSLYGVFFDEKQNRFLRIKDERAANVNDGVFYLNKNTSGGRLRFSTDSKNFFLKARWSELTIMNHMPLSGSSAFTLLEETDEGEFFVSNFIPDVSDSKGMQRYKGLPGDKMRNYILYFPLYNDVEELTVGFDADAKVGPGKPYKNILPVLYYGSSITQGGCASRPDNAYQALISKWTNVDFINLGFSGNAKGEKEMMEYLSSIPCSVFVYDYDYNAPTHEHLAVTHYNGYRIFRDKNPLIPVIMLTRPNFDTDPADSGARLEIVRSSYERAVSEDDKLVRFIPGNQLFGEKDRERFTVDGCHPTDTGFYKMAERIYAAISEFL